MERWNDHVALVTGASAGIGAAICIKLVESGLTVVGCARNAHKIEELAREKLQSYPDKLLAIKCDLAKENEIEAMFCEIRKKYGRLDICINNAGIISNGSLLTGETSAWRNMFEVDILSLCICTREAVKLMREEPVKEGQIINISSIAGHRVPEEKPETPGCSFYIGTKFMTRALTECLRQEVAPGNTEKSLIRVASISPGLTDTQFLRRCLGDDVFHALYSQKPSLQPKDVADAVVYILKSPPSVNVGDVVVLPVEKGKN